MKEVNKSDVTRIHLCMEADELEQFKAYCKANYRSISSQLRLLINGLLKEADKKEGN